MCQWLDYHRFCIDSSPVQHQAIILMLVYWQLDPWEQIVEFVSKYKKKYMLENASGRSIFFYLWLCKVLANLSRN